MFWSIVIFSWVTSVYFYVYSGDKNYAHKEFVKKLKKQNCQELWQQLSGNHKYRTFNSVALDTFLKVYNGGRLQKNRLQFIPPEV